jgi:SAM-dependent methyltransferase
MSENIPEKNIYVVPKAVTELEKCGFYHTMEIPGHGVVEGEWDLRDNLEAYLGGTDFKNKRVLDIGAANGCLSFFMEKQGAEVISYDLSEDHSWDVVPHSGYDWKKLLVEDKYRAIELNNAYWFCHKVFNSSAKFVHGTVYTIPEEIGTVDISVFGSILLHVRDPFLALEMASRVTKETIIVVEPIGIKRFILYLLSFGLAGMNFLPSAKKTEHKVSWWAFTPKIIEEFIGVLGFVNIKTKFHFQKYRFSRLPVLCFTVVGNRKSR